jgi:hypothetical protein
MEESYADIIYRKQLYLCEQDAPTLAQIAAEGENWVVESVTKGGWSFAHYINSENPMHAPFVEKLAQPWDCIFLQEQSLRPVDGRETFLRTAQALCELISPPPKKLLYYVTWGRQDGCDLLTKWDMTCLEMTEKLPRRNLLYPLWDG